jgi:hypothetical protein
MDDNPDVHQMLLVVEREQKEDEPGPDGEYGFQTVYDVISHGSSDPFETFTTRLDAELYMEKKETELIDEFYSDFLSDHWDSANRIAEQEINRQYQKEEMTYFNTGNLVLHGGQNYQEWLFNIPVERRFRDSILLKQTPEGRWFSSVKPDKTYATNIEAAVNAYKDAGVYPAVETHWNEKDEAFGHVIAHARTDDRGIQNSSETVKFIEEIQSDVHQRAREEGYRSGIVAALQAMHEMYGPKGESKLLNNIKSIHWLGTDITKDGPVNATKRIHITYPYGVMSRLWVDKNNNILKGERLLTEGYTKPIVQEVAYEGRNLAGFVGDDIAYMIGYKAYGDMNSHEVLNYITGPAVSDLYDEIKKSYNRAVPDYPYKKTWHELAFKRILRAAAEEGKDWIAWTKGVTQVERYKTGLRQKVKAIHFHKTEDDGRWIRVEASSNESIVFQTDKEGEVTAGDPGYLGTIYGKNIAEIVGKNIANKIMEPIGKGVQGQIAGEDLTIGGEGMKGFYDGIMVNFVNKYVKKWGAKVEEIKVTTDKTPVKAWGVWVTPELAKAVLYQGQPAFSRRTRAIMVYDPSIQKKVVIQAPKEAMDLPEASPMRLHYTWQALRAEASSILEKYNNYIIHGKNPGWFEFITPSSADQMRDFGDVYRVTYMADYVNPTGHDYLSKDQAVDRIAGDLYWRGKYILQPQAALSRRGAAGQGDLFDRSYQEPLPFMAKAVDPPVLKQIDMFGNENETKQAIEKYVREQKEKDAAGGAEDEDLPIFNNNLVARAGEAQGRLFSRRAAAPAPNIETPEFKAWFKGSKVVDAQGKPLKVYHGTIHHFYEFEGDTFSFTMDPDYADRYAQTFFYLPRPVSGMFMRGAAPKIIPAYLSIKNPIDLVDAERTFSLQQFLNLIGSKKTAVKKYKTEPNEIYGNPTGFTRVWDWVNYHPEIKAELQALGYDGATWKEGTPGERAQKVFVAFEPTQIKSVWNKTFSPEARDIRFSRRIINTAGIASQTKMKNIYKDGEYLDKDFEGGKKGDMAAARRFIGTQVNENDIIRLRRYLDPRVDNNTVFVTQPSTTGRNVIPLALAEKVAKIYDAPVIPGNQIAISARTEPAKNVNKEDRPFEQKHYALDPNADKILAGRNIVLVDDVLSQAGSIANMERVLQTMGHNVAGLVGLIGDPRIYPTPTDGIVADFKREIMDRTAEPDFDFINLLTRMEDYYILTHSQGLKNETAKRQYAERILGLLKYRTPAAIQDAARWESNFPGYTEAQSFGSEYVGPEPGPGNRLTEPEQLNLFHSVRLPKSLEESPLDRAIGEAVVQGKLRPTTPDINEEEVAPATDIERAMDAAKGLQKPSMVAKAREAAKGLYLDFTRAFPLLDSKKYGYALDLLRQYKAVGDYANAVSSNYIHDIISGLGKNKYKVFTYNVILPDLIADVEDGLHQERGIPFKAVNAEELRTIYGRFKTLAQKYPDIQDALNRRNKFMDTLKDEQIKLGILPAELAEDPHYYHHQVLSKMAEREFAGLGTRPKDVRVHKSGYQYGRTGSAEDYNTEYLEAEFEVVAQAISKVETLKVLKLLKDRYDITRDLKRKAFEKNEENWIGKETLAEIARLQGLREEAREEGDKSVIKDLTEQIWQLDPRMKYNAMIAMARAKLAKMAYNGDFDNPNLFTDPGMRDEIRRRGFDSVVDMLAQEEQGRKEEEVFYGDEDQEFMDQGAANFFPFLNFLLENGLPGAMQAGTIYKNIAGKKREMFENLRTRNIQIQTPATIAPAGYTEWSPLTSSPLYIVEAVADKAIKQLEEQETVEIAKGDLRKVMTQAKKPTWMIPEELAATLDEFRATPADEGVVDQILRGTMTSWKQWTLFNPMHVVKYFTNNMSGDLDISLAYDPGIMKEFAGAAKDLWNYYIKKGKPTADILEAIRLAVVGSGFSMTEIKDISEEGIFSLLTGKDPGPITKAWRGIKTLNDFRENILRLAAYRRFQKRIQNGEKIYGASKKVEVDAVTGTKEKAAKVARELIGDYGNISKAGQWSRAHLIPFYSWIEINAPRYARLLKNIPNEEGPGINAVGRIGKMIGVKAARTLAKMFILYLLVNLWNRLKYPEEEKELGERNRQLHLILGRRRDGTIITFRFQGALSDALGWFGAEDLPSDIWDVVNGKATYLDKIKDGGLTALNKAVSGVGPFYKLYEPWTGTLYPDLTNPRAVRDKAEWLSKLFSLDVPYRFAAGKPTRGYGEFTKALVYENEPGETAYNNTMNIIRRFNKKYAEQASGLQAAPTDKANAIYYYKQALKFDDMRAAKKYIQQYVDLGGTSKSFKQSIKAYHPLMMIAKKDMVKFMETLDKNDQKKLEKAITWWGKTYVEQTNEKLEALLPDEKNTD